MGILENLTIFYNRNSALVEAWKAAQAASSAAKTEREFLQNRIRDLENEIDRLATRRAQLEHIHLADLDKIDALRGLCERQAAEISIQSDQLLMMSEHLNESSKQRDTTRAQVNDLSAEVVKMTEEIRQLRGMIP